MLQKKNPKTLVKKAEKVLTEDRTIYCPDDILLRTAMCALYSALHEERFDAVAEAYVMLRQTHHNLWGKDGAPYDPINYGSER